MRKRYTDYSIFIQLIGVPFAWILAVIKIALVIPMFIVSKCNKFLDSIEPPDQKLEREGKRKIDLWLKNKQELEGDEQK